MLRSERGQNLVELALVMPLLILLLAGMADLGRAFFSYIQITNAAREGARAATRLPCYPADAAQRGVYADRIRQITRAEVDGVIVDPGDLTIAISPRPVEDGCQTPGQPIEVTVSYPYVTILSGGSGIGNFTINSSTAMARIGKSP
ncbi:MAG: pilus assembly protein [Anaerolineae bacterium]|jgi:Flp pilus assembly protein TadG|nr:pilus assembly protein [Anaerolineae bacterium]